VTVGLLSLALPLLLLAISGIALWNALAWPSLTLERAESEGSVSILIPARDEAANIAPCVEAALAQGRSIREVLVYDDRSGDGTAAIVNRLAASDPRVRVIEGFELPDGWCGKNHACARLAKAAQGEWLLFLDADARLTPGALPRLLAEAHTRQVTLMSPWPALIAGTFWERVLMPMLEVLTFSVWRAGTSTNRLAAIPQSGPRSWRTSGSRNSGARAAGAGCACSAGTRCECGCIVRSGRSG
jgi:cellulose synthase/poly-beta-1,6-N-acetylglucosamine synthase-like glycosyltransferase